MKQIYLRRYTLTFIFNIYHSTRAVSYLVKPHTTDWEDGIFALEAGQPKSHVSKY